MSNDENSGGLGSSTGGRALGLGVTYQAMGAIAGALTDWKLSAVDEELEFGVLDIQGQDRLSILSEHFDMDAVLQGGDGVVFVQFKATGQQNRPVFSKTDAREILISAARSYFHHLAYGGNEMRRFVLATNRREGEVFAALRQAKSTIDPNLSDEQAKEQFGQLPAVQALWNGNASQTIRDQAQSLMSLSASIPEPERSQRIDACLAVMLRYTYAEVKPIRVRETLGKWLQTWGVLPDEEDTTINTLVGILNAKGATGQITTPDHLFRELHNQPLSSPLTLHQLGPKASERLATAFDREPPTSGDAAPIAFAPWMVPRSNERGAAWEALTKTDSVHRLAAFVGSGGTGKTRLMHQTMRAVMGLDAEGEDPTPGDSKWGPYLSILMTRDRLSSDNVREAVRSFSDHGAYLDHVERRLSVANGKGPNGCALCLGIDGLDEIDDTELEQVLSSIESYVADREGVRVVLTCRDAEWRRISDHPRLAMLTLRVPVEDFGEDVALRQFNAALGINLAPPVGSPNVSSATGMRSVGGIEPSIDPAMYVAIRHPLMFGSIKTFKDDGGDAEVRQACEGDDAGQSAVARRFMRDFCVRVERRINLKQVGFPDVFNALKSLAVSLSDPVSAKWTDWTDACEATPALGNKGEILFYQCASSGFILEEARRPAFRWRHAFVGRALAGMEEPQWP